TGWINAQQDYTPIATAGATLVRVPPFDGGVAAPAILLDARPFSVMRFVAESASAADICNRLRLELDACSTTTGQATVNTVTALPLAEETRLDLYGTTTTPNHVGPVRVD